MAGHTPWEEVRDKASMAKATIPHGCPGCGGTLSLEWREGVPWMVCDGCEVEVTPAPGTTVGDVVAPMIWCRCTKDAEGNLIPERECEIHWHHVIDASSPLPPEMYP